MRNNKGFTVLELVIALAIGAVLTAVAVHTISSKIPGKHLSGATLALQSDLSLAKMEALKSGKQYMVTVSGSSYTFSVGDKASGSGTWTIDSSSALPYPDVTLTGGPIVFDPRGTVSSSTDITLENSEGIKRTISVSIAGRIRSS